MSESNDRSLMCLILFFIMVNQCSLSNNLDKIANKYAPREASSNPLFNPPFAKKETP